MSTPLKNWISAARIRTLPAALAPVLIGCAMAYEANGFHLPSALSALLGAVFIQIGTNFANDYFDFINGVDNEHRVGPQRATQSGNISPQMMKWAFIVSFLATIPLVGYLAYRGGWELIAVGILSIASGILYTGGPIPLGYIGLGDLFVLIFFGPVAVGGTYYVQTLSLSTDVVFIGISSGLISTAILVVNNLRDKTEDQKVGKNTLAVLLGSRFARFEYTFCLTAAGFLSAYIALTNKPWASLSLIAILSAFPTIVSMWKDEGAALDPNLGKTARTLILFSALFSVGWCL
ncbi:MAG: 1,4-dihydroxy-2-naphthoate polyprenyltransferase [Proteobacteria bacterium]|nr:1,4-dihydroxy-2-naphthoate polyprenyltransferase [Pseudomonadota bacterium]